jgi:hypothetical protein
MGSSIRLLSGKMGALIVSALAAIGYLVVSSLKYRNGFPLDDAWIHQTYARNLIEGGTWSFTTGVASGGSTSPLWTLVMGLGYLLRIDPRVWSYVVGTLLLGSIGFLGAKWGELRHPVLGKWGWLVVILAAVEWHLAWAAVSGMETLAICVMILITFWLVERNAEGWVIGIVLGVGMWVRPGAITLLLPVGLYGLYHRSDEIRSLLNWSLKVGMGFLALLIPYLAFNYWITGTIWPNTFYAKQTEYSILQDAPLLARFLQQSIQPMVGVGIVLFPGILLSVLRHYRERTLLRMAPLVWVFLHWFMYAWRLPVVYQHGRYAIPTIPVLIILGAEGFFSWIALESEQVRRRFLSRTWIVLLAVVGFVFYWIGARAYAADVAIIESEMVEASKWIALNTGKDALIAAHDIGALGYYGRREILDLAGLISPEVIPFIRDEAKISQYLDQRGAQYLMTFPGWYPELTAEAKLVYSTEGGFSPAEGGENMEIFLWR